MSQRSIVVNGYRRLLRATKGLFGRDLEALTKSRAAIREVFEENRNQTDPKTLQDCIKGIDEAEEMLTQHLVQGRLNERGNYQVSIQGHKEEPGKCAPALEPVSKIKLEE